MGLLFKVSGKYANFTLTDYEIRGYEFLYAVPDSKYAKGHKDQRKLIIKGSVPRTLEKNREVLEEIRKWVKVQYKDPEYYSFAKVTHIHRDEVIREITFPDAFIYDFEEEIDPYTGDGTYVLTLMQKADKRIDIIVDPFNEVFPKLSDLMREVNQREKESVAPLAITTPTNPFWVRVSDLATFQFDVFPGETQPGHHEGSVSMAYAQVGNNLVTKTLLPASERIVQINPTTVSKIRYSSGEYVTDLGSGIRNINNQIGLVNGAMVKVSLPIETRTFDNNPQNWIRVLSWRRGRFDHVMQTPTEFMVPIELFVTQSTRNLRDRTDEVIQFTDTEDGITRVFTFPHFGMVHRNGHNNNYFGELSDNSHDLRAVHQAIYTGAYCMPMQNLSGANFSQGFWGDHSHAGTGSRETGGAVDIGTARSAGRPWYAMLDGTVRNISFSSRGASFIQVESSILGQNYILHYLHIEHNGRGYPTPTTLGIENGDRIQRGARIATVGGPPDWAYHIDLQVHDSSGRILDPLRFFDIEKRYNVSSYMSTSGNGRGYSGNEYNVRVNPFE